MPVYAVIDVETTGLAATTDRVLELSVIRCDAEGAPLDEWVSRFNPQGPVGATHIHGISAEDVREAPLFSTVVPALAGNLAGLVLVAHNARFDLAFLRAEFSRAGWRLPAAPALCTLEESWIHLPALSRRRLPDCCAAAGVRHSDAHSALGDARAAAGLLACYLQPRRGGVGLYDRLPVEARRVVWPIEPSEDPIDPPPVRPSAAPRRYREVRVEQRRLVEMLDTLALDDVLPEGAAPGAAGYLELLAEVLEDGVLTDAEVASLADLALLYDLGGDELGAIHDAFLLALADRAVGDGRVSQAERAELYAVADLLAIPHEGVLIALDAAVGRKSARQSVGLSALPAGWTHGEPLRVGDGVVFTGCDEDLRTALEDRARARGVRVLGNVSGKTAMLVTDGSFAGTKLEAARSRGTRVVTPEVFAILLDHLQPAAPSPARARSKHGRGVPTAQVGAPQVSEPREDVEVSPSEVRAWARAHGIEVGVRGRLPHDVMERFRAAQVARD